MEGVAQQIIALSIPDSFKETEQLIHFLNQVEDEFGRNPDHVDQMLLRLDASQHSLAYLFFLHVKARQQCDPVVLFNQIAAFFVNYTASHILHVRERLPPVIHRFTEIASSSRIYAQAIKPLEVGLRRLQPSPETLTPFHPELLRMCLLSKFYFAAQPLLSTPVLEVDHSTGAVPRDLLAYYYYAGMIHTGLKNYTEAIDCFHQTVTLPAPSASAIAVEAYKKLVLLSLIKFGQVSSLPRYTSTAVNKAVGKMCALYNDVASAFTKRQYTLLLELANNNAELFMKDHNMGLVKQVLRAYTRSNVRRLTHTYMTLSLSDIAQNANLSNAAEAESLLLQMIQDGEIFASIDQRNGMVSFHEDPALSDNSVLFDKLGAHMEQAMGMAAKLAAVEDALSLDEKYIRKISQQAAPNRRGWVPDELFEGAH